MSDTDETLPYELRDYISKRQRDAGEANNADHRPTYQAELDEIAAEATKLYRKGEKLLKGVSTAEREQCKALMQVEFGEMAKYRSDKLIRQRVDSSWLIGPAYLSKLAAARFLQPFFASATEDA